MADDNEIMARLRRAIENCEYAEIPELAKDSGVGVETINKFMAGGDMLLSDASRLVETMNGALILPYDWRWMQQNLEESIDSEHMIYIESNNGPYADVYFEEVYPPIKSLLGNGEKSFLITGIQTESLKKIAKFIKEKSILNFTLIDDYTGYEFFQCHFEKVNPYSKTAIIKFKDWKKQVE